MTIDRSEAARALRAIPRQRTARVCPICGQPFAGYGRQVFCANACRQRNKHQKQRVAYPKSAALTEAQWSEIDDRLRNAGYPVLTPAEGREIFDQHVRAKLGISGPEFVARFDRGEYPDWDPPLADLVMLLPLMRARA